MTPAPPKRALATLASIVVFLVILVVGTPLAYMALSHGLMTKREFPGGVPPGRFFVAYRELTPSGPTGPVHLAWWKDIEAARSQGGKFTFALPVPGGIIASPSDFHAYSVLEDRGASQVIETRYRNTHGEWARYEAWPDRIVPISHRQDGGGFALLIPLLAMVVAGVIAANKVEYALRRRCPPNPEVPR